MELLNDNISLNLSLRTPAELDSAVVYLTISFQISVQEVTPCVAPKTKEINLSLVVREKLAEKRRLRRCDGSILTIRMIIESEITWPEN